MCQSNFSGTDLRSHFLYASDSDSVHYVLCSALVLGFKGRHVGAFANGCSALFGEFLLYIYLYVRNVIFGWCLRNKKDNEMHIVCHYQQQTFA
jgi:hypothetical protein